jgi:hypothetical protein
MLGNGQGIRKSIEVRTAPAVAAVIATIFRGSIQVIPSIAIATATTTRDTCATATADISQSQTTLRKLAAFRFY